MVGLEKLALLKMDFLGLTTLTIIEDALKLIERHRGVTLTHRRSAARRSENLRVDFQQGLHQRRVPVRIAGHARHSAPLPAGSHRGSDRAERALPPRPHGHDRRLHRSQARPQGSGLRSAGDEGNPGRDLRRDGLPGTGDADLQSHRRLLAGRSRSAAPRHGQEEGRGDGQAARALRRRRAKQGPSAEQGRKDLRPDGEVRRLRIQ